MTCQLNLATKITLAKVVVIIPQQAFFGAICLRPSRAIAIKE